MVYTKEQDTQRKWQKRVRLNFRRQKKEVKPERYKKRRQLSDINHYFKMKECVTIAGGDTRS